MKKMMVFAIILLASVMIQAIPVPHGVSGYIYELDGITQVRQGINFVVNDTTTGNYVAGKTGHGGETGRYVVAINGNDGDTIKVRAWTSLHFSETTLTLSGVMGNINLILNTTVPEPPVIWSNPSSFANEDSEYIYDINASDADNDELSITLAEYPSGMTINGTRISWTPLQANIGINSIKIRVDDGTFSTYQNFSINVSNVNDVPSIISVPVFEIAQNAQYEYVIIASDEDGDNISFELVLAPTRMTIFNNIISWTPNNSHVGNNSIILKASDNNSSTLQQFIINVTNVNDAPFFLSSPIINATEDTLYTYLISAIDFDNDLLNYSLVASPAGMNINNSNITWLPGNEHRGFNNVTIKVSDRNASVFQTFLVYVANTNDAPEITSIPLERTTLGTTYTYDVEALDPDNDTISFVLADFPGEMTINNATGFIEWKPRGVNLGINAVVVNVSDGQEIVSHSFSLIVTTPGSGNAGGGGGAQVQSIIEPITEQRIESVISGSDDILELSIGGIDGAEARINPLSERPADTKPISKRVYKYFSIDASSEIKNSEIKFRVEKSWLNTNNIDKENIVLNRYSNEAWNPLPTSFLNEEGEFYIYKARTPGFSYFAISVRDEKKIEEINTEQEPTVIESPFSSFSIAGQIFEPNGRDQIEAGTSVNITNLNTSRIFTAKTGIGPYPGGFFMIVDGKTGDILQFEVEGSRGKTQLILNGDNNNIKLIRRKNVLEFPAPPITGFSVMGLGVEEARIKPIGVAVFAIIGLSILFYFNRRKK